VAVSHARSGRRPHGVGCAGYHSTWHQLPEHVTNVRVLFWDGTYTLSRSTQRTGGHQLQMADSAQHGPVAALQRQAVGHGLVLGSDRTRGLE
jgi:hypothetical protein